MGCLILNCFRLPFLIALLLTPTFAIGAEAQLKVVFVLVRDPEKPQDTTPRLRAIRIAFEDSEKKAQNVIRTDSAALVDSTRFRIVKGGDTAHPVKFQIRLKQPDPKQPLASEIRLIPEKSDATSKYTVELLQTPGQPPGLEIKNQAPIAKFGPIDVEHQGSADTGFLNRNKAVQTNFAVLGGKDGSSASVKLAYGLDSFSKPGASTDRFWRFQSMLDADVSYRPKKNHDYINSINGEADFVLAQYFQAPRLGGVRGLYETGFAGRFESDQLFDKVNLTVGWTNWLSLNAPGLDKFATGICLLGKPEAAVPPILVFSYDYVSPVKNDLSADNQGVETGRNRLRGRFYWSLALAHDADLLVVHHYDADLLIDVGAIYDFESGKTLPDLRLSLDIGPVSEDKTAPRFTLSYVNGKTTPTFRNYNALLAGIKLPF